jgi:adenylate kinase
MIVTLMGAPGSGKGTQGRQLAASLGYPYLASGDLVRKALAERTAWGESVRSYIEAGHYVPDDVIVPVFIEALCKVMGGTECGAILDGFPRTAEQAVALDKASSHVGHTALPCAVVLEVPEEVLISRLSGRWLCVGCHATYNVQVRPSHMPGVCDACGEALEQRVDDRRETIRSRLAVYHENTTPVLGFYRSRGGLASVDGDLAAGEVRDALIEATRQLMASKE